MRNPFSCVNQKGHAVVANLKDMVNKHASSNYIMVLVHDYATLKLRGGGEGEEITIDEG